MRRTGLRRQDGALMPVNTPTPEVIDWRTINDRQWRTGMRATHGEDGERLTTLRLGVISEPVLEDDHEVPLED